MRSAPSSIHLWVPGIREGSGGIQAFSRFLVAAMHEIHSGAKLRVFVKNDAPAPDDPLRKLPVSFHSVHALPSALRSTALAAMGVGLGLKDSPALAFTTHAHFLPAMSVLQKTRKIPCGTMLHGIEAWNLRAGSRQRALREADRLIAVSRFTRDQVAGRFGIDATRIDLLSNTYDESRFAPGPKPPQLLERFGLQPDQPVLLTVSRLSWAERYKGHRQVLEALPQIRKVVPGVRYLIGGEGDDLPQLREAARQHGVDDLVIFAGHIAGDQLPDYYRLCDVFVMPSTEEGFGIVFLEAMSAGKPVIAGNVDGSVDALDDGRLGVLVDPRNPSAIAAAVIEVLLRRNSNPLIFQPENLHRAVADTFGFQRFRDRLAAILGKQS